MVKLRQRISGCMRTLTRATQFCRIRSYLATAARHGRHALAAAIEFQPTLQRQHDDAETKHQTGRRQLFERLLERLDNTEAS